MYQSKDHCTGMKDRITRDRENSATQKPTRNPHRKTSVHLEQQVELRKKVESGSTIADSEAAWQVHLSCVFFLVEQTTKASTSNVVDRATMEEKRAISLMHTSEHRDREGEIDRAVY